MKKTLKKIGSFSLALTLLATQVAVNPTVVRASTMPSISVSANTNVDVALAVGSTSVDYSAFEEKLKEDIGSRIPNSNINIMATTSVDTATSSDFDWMEFDHSYNSATYSGTSDFIDQTVESNSNAYNTIDRHVVLDTTSGTALTFRGYGSKANSDFMLLENNQTTNKTFQFNIKEYFAADALYNIGFFFNSNLTYDTATYTDQYAAYQADKLFLNGYLMALNYTGNATSGLSIFKVNNLPLNSYHNANLSIYGGVGTDTVHFTQIATLNASSTGAYKASDDLRKFRVEVTPSTVTVYYAGFDDETHTVTSVSSESAAQSFTESSAGYTAFKNTSYADLTPVTFKLTNNTTTNKVSLDTNSGGSDFGPMVKYGSHGCGQLTKVELSNLTMATDVVRALNEVVREPNWRADSTKLLVNLNEDTIHDFENEELTGDLLNRLQNENIYYVGWCSDKNVTASQDFLKKNDLKGILVNVDSADTSTYTKQIEKIADAVVTRYEVESGTTTDGDAVVVTKGTDIVLGVTGASVSNTADESYPNGRWGIKYYDVKGDFISSKTSSNLELDFTNAGTYKIYYEGTEPSNLIKTIIVNEPPTASFSVSVASSGAISANLTNTSTDAEGTSMTSVWKYLEVASGSAFTVLGQDSNQNAVLSPMEAGKIYLVSLTVTDKWGASTTVSKQVSYDESQSALPTADFSLSVNKIVRNATGEAISGSNLINVTNKSYDMYGRTITSNFACATGAGFTIEPVVGKEGSYTIDTTSLSAGTYPVYLTVNNGLHTSNRVARFFTILVDQDGPTASASPSSGTLSQGSENVQLNFSDEGSGVEKSKVIISTSKTAPTLEEWEATSYNFNKTLDVSFANMEGTYYIHYLVVDKLGNQKVSYVGPYAVDVISPTISEIVSPVNGDTNVAVAPVIQFKTSENTTKGNGYLYIRKVSDDSVVYSVYAKSNLVRISGKTITLNPLVTLENDTAYYISFSKDFVEDSSNNQMAAYNGKASWNFTTKKANEEIKTNEIQIVGVDISQSIADGNGGKETTKTKAQPGTNDNTFTVYVYEDSSTDATLHINVKPNYSVAPKTSEVSLSKGSADISYTQKSDGSYDITIPATVASGDKTLDFTVKGETYKITFVTLGSKSKNVSSKVVKFGSWASGDWISAPKINLENAVDVSDVTDMVNNVEVNVKLVANADTSQINSADMAAMSSSISGDLKFIDIKVIKSVTINNGTAVDTQIHNTLVPIHVTLNLPTEMMTGEYDVEVYRIHDNVISLMNSTLSSDKTKVEFDSDAYSTYALKYTATNSGGAPIKPVNTNVETPVSYEMTNPKDVSVSLEAKKTVKQISFNGSVLDAGVYEIKDGVLTLEKAIFNGLKKGTYSLVVTYTDAATQTFTLNTVAFDASKTMTNVPVFNLVKNMSVGNEFRLTLTGIKGIADVVYTTSNSKIASVSSNGTIKAKKNGKATVTAVVTQNGSQYKVEIAIKVQKGMPFNRTIADSDAISINTSLPVLNIYKRVYIGKKTSIQVKNIAKDAVVSYTSDIESVATVSKNGTITAIAAGECVVTAKIKQDGKTYCYKVLVRVPEAK